MTLRECLQESLLDVDDVISHDDKTDLIHDFLKKNYIFHTSIRPQYTIENGVVNVNGSCEVKNRSKFKHLTNGLFKFGKVLGFFDCGDCDIETLEGAPEYCSTDFYCNRCDSLKSLDGSPKYVGGDFDCSGCTSLTSLKGAPKEVNNFYCTNCKLLKSIKPGPKRIKGDLEAQYCPNLKMSEDDIRKVIKINGDILRD